MNLHKQEGRYLIGSFSKLSNFSTKTLIWYDKIGILKPEYTDENNFIIDDLHRNLQIKGYVKNIDGVDYLFAQVEHNVEPYDVLYVYKKEMSAQEYKEFFKKKAQNLMTAQDYREYAKKKTEGLNFDNND